MSLQSSIRHGSLVYPKASRCLKSSALTKSSLYLNLRHFTRTMSVVAPKSVNIEVKDGIRTIYLNQPKKRNAIGEEMRTAIGDALTQANTDRSTKIVVFTGTGEYFCSGHDLSNFPMGTDAKASIEELRKQIVTFVASFIDCLKPVVLLVNGPAVGLGVAMFGLADIVYASEKAYLSTPFTALGTNPEACSSYTFPKIMGYAKANELLLFNAKITARQAEATGLVSKVFPHEIFTAETTKRIQAMVQLPGKSLLYSKELIRGRERKLLHEINLEESYRLLELWQLHHFRTALNTFLSRNKQH